MDLFEAVLAPRMDLFQAALAPRVDLFQVSLLLSIPEYANSRGAKKEDDARRFWQERSP